MCINYRKLNKKDYKKVKLLIIDAWFKSYDISSKMKNSFANLYLYHYLGNSNFTEVAEIDDNIAGFIFGRVKKVTFFHKLGYNIKFFFLVIKLCFSKIGRYAIKTVKYENSLNKTMYAPYKDMLYNEINLIITNNNYREHGIGKKLVQDLEQFALDNNEHHLFLFTDTYSTYKFYDHLGFKRISKEDPVLFDDEDAAYYLYAKKF